MTTRRRTSEKTTSTAADEELAQSRQRIQELEAEAAEGQNRYIRLAADFDNYKKRSRQDQMETIQYGSAALIARILPVVDDFRLVLEHAPEDVDQGWRKGLELTLQKLEAVLAEQGLTPIEALGAAFDPNLHEAIGYEESSEHPEDTVTSELRRGYRLHDRVVRPALVRVARPPSLPLPSAAEAE